MNMRRGINYLLLLSNWVVAIGVVIVLGIYLFNKDKPGIEYSQPMILSIISPIVAEIIASCLLGLYTFLLNKSLKKDVHINPKLLSLIKSSSLLSIINLVLPLVFSITASTLDANNKTIALALIITSLSISILFGLFMSGYTSYINLRISFNEEKRKALQQDFEPTMKIYQDDTKYKDEETKEKYKPKKESDSIDETLATSGTFNEN